MSGQPDFAVYDFINGQRLNTGYHILEGGKPAYFVFVITPTSTIYSQINSVISTERIEMFSLLAGVTAAIAVVILFLIRWSSTLEREVKRRTKETNESNQRLEEEHSHAGFGGSSFPVSGTASPGLTGHRHRAHRLSNDTGEGLGKVVRRYAAGPFQLDYACASPVLTNEFSGQAPNVLCLAG